MKHIYLIASYPTFEQFYKTFHQEGDSAVITLKTSYALSELLDFLHSEVPNNKIIIENYKSINLKKIRSFYNTPRKYYKKISKQIEDFIEDSPFKIHFYNDTFLIEFFIIINELKKKYDPIVCFYGNHYTPSKYNKFNIKHIIKSLILKLYYNYFNINLDIYWNGYTIEIQWKHNFKISDTVEEYYNSQLPQKIKFSGNSSNKKILYLHSPLDVFDGINHQKTYRKVSEYLTKTYKPYRYDIFFKNHPDHDYIPLEFRELLLQSTIIPSFIHPFLMDDEFDKIYTIYSTAIKSFNLKKSYLLSNLIVYSKDTSILKDYIELTLGEVVKIRN
jgi:hypothetical protein